jgi:hypothetical protein
MPLNFAAYFIQEAIEKSTIATREHLMNLIAKLPDYTYPILNDSLKSDNSILQSVFLNNRKNFYLLKYAPIELRRDRQFVLKLIKLDESVLGFIDKSLLEDLAFVKLLILANSKTILFLTEQFQVIYNNNKEEFDEIEKNYLAAVKKQDYEIAAKYRDLVNIIRLYNNGGLINKPIEIIETDKSRTSQLNYDLSFSFDKAKYLNEDNYLDETILYLPHLYSSDKDVALHLLNRTRYTFTMENATEYILNNLNESLRNNEEIAKQELTRNGLMLKYFSDNIKKNPDLVKIAIQNNVEAYFQIHPELRVYNNLEINKELLFIAMQLNPSVLLHVDKHWLKDEEILITLKNKRPILHELIIK